MLSFPENLHKLNLWVIHSIDLQLNPVKAPKRRI